MPQRPSQTRIVNAAAALLGSTQRLSSINDTGDLAMHARDQWDSIVRTMLAEHPWNFAIVRATLNEAADAPESEYERKFAMPADNWRWLPWMVGDEDWFQGEEEGDFILTDAEGPLVIRYMSGDRIDQVGLWSAHFANAVEVELAARLAEPMTGSTSLARSKRAEAEAALKNAKRVDALASNGKRGPHVSRRSNWGRRRFITGLAPGQEG